jgi:hypothetical protein
MSNRSYGLFAVYSVPLLATLVSFGLLSQQRDDQTAKYYAAYCRINGAVENQELVVFPLHGRAVSIPLPFYLGRIVFSQDGRAIYGQDNPPKRRGLVRIDFSPTRVTRVIGSEGLVALHSMAVSSAADKILVSGEYQRSGQTVCGILELDVKSANLTTILETEDCRYRNAWGGLSVSPNGEMALAARKGSLVLIDLLRKQTRKISDNVLRATWSPDGKWVAAIGFGEPFQTTLLDGQSFRVLRTLPGDSGSQWSPDSRYLLGSTACPGDYATLEMVEIQSRSRTAIESSACNAWTNTAGWVSGEILR